MDRTSGPVGPLWIVLAFGMLAAAPAGAATIHLISAGPAGMAVDALSVRLPPRAATARPSVQIYRGALLRQAAGIGRAGRCLAAGGTTLAALGAGSGLRAALGQCLVAAGPSAAALADAASPADPAVTRRRADRATEVAPARGRRIHIALVLPLPPAAEDMPGGIAAGLPIGPVVAEGLGDPAFGGLPPGPEMPPAAPVPIPASGFGLMAALGLLLRRRRRSV